MSDRPNSDPPVRAGEIDPDAITDPLTIDASELLALSLSGDLQVSSGSLALVNEAVEDIVGGMAGSNLSYDDANNQIDAAGSSDTQALAYNFVGAGTDSYLRITNFPAAVGGSETSVFRAAIQSTDGTTATLDLQDFTANSTLASVSTSQQSEIELTDTSASVPGNGNSVGLNATSNCAYSEAMCEYA